MKKLIRFAWLLLATMPLLANAATCTRVSTGHYQTFDGVRFDKEAANSATSVEDFTLFASDDGFRVDLRATGIFVPQFGSSFVRDIALRCDNELVSISSYGTVYLNLQKVVLSSGEKRYFGVNNASFIARTSNSNRYEVDCSSANKALRVNSYLGTVGFYSDLFLIAANNETTGDGLCTLNGLHEGKDALHIDPQDSLLNFYNQALDKPATQSSTRAGQVAVMATDGAVNGADVNGYSATLTEVNPWWQVDLGDTYDLQEVRLYTYRRDRDCCGIDEFYIMVSDSPMQGKTYAELLSDSSVTKILYDASPDRVRLLELIPFPLNN